MKHVPFRGLGAILFKEFIIVWRDPMTLFFMFFPPLIEMIAFGYALDTDVKHMAMVILNEDRTVESRQFIDRFREYGNIPRGRRSAERRRTGERNSPRPRLCRTGNSAAFTRDVHAGQSGAGAIAGGWIELHDRAASAQHRGWRRADAIGRDRSCEKLVAATSRSISGRKCSTTRRCAARTFLFRA